MRSLTTVLRSVWWISWLAIITAFFCIGGMEYRYEFSQGGVSSYFSLTLLIVDGLAWILFFVVDALAREKVEGEKNKELVVSLLTMTGTVLAVFTLLGTFFFSYIAPRVH
jgi:hypothetical protein